MARKHKRGNEPEAQQKAETPPETAPQPTTEFTSRLSPLMGCRKGVLRRSRIEFYAGLGTGILVGIMRMSGLTRSFFLLIVAASRLVDRGHHIELM
jgi:hypothetical protein